MVTPSFKFCILVLLDVISLISFPDQVPLGGLAPIEKQQHQEKYKLYLHQGSHA